LWLYFGFFLKNIWDDEQQIGEVYNNRYIIVRKLGWGHFSTVWLTYDITTRNKLALKIQKSAKHYTGNVTLLFVSSRRMRNVFFFCIKKIYRCCPWRDWYSGHGDSRGHSRRLPRCAIVWPLYTPRTPWLTCVRIGAIIPGSMLNVLIMSMCFFFYRHVLGVWNVGRQLANTYQGQ
jgi:hypothetical protein